MQTPKELAELAIERGVCSLEMSKKLNWQMPTFQKWALLKSGKATICTISKIEDFPSIKNRVEKIIYAPSVGDLLKVLIVQDTFSMDLLIKFSSLKHELAKNQVNLADVLAEFYLKTQK